MAQPENILIVGGTGMIGGYAALHLHSRGYAVTLAGRHPIKDIPVLKDLPFIKIDYVSGEYTPEVFSSFDSILFSAGADVRHVPQNSSADEYYLQASEAIVKFARSARDAGVARFVHIGSFYPHIAPQLVDTVPYIRSRKLAADGITSLTTTKFHACSLDAPFVVGVVPGMKVPMFVAYTQFAEGKLGIPPSAPTGNTNFVSVESLAIAITAALERSESVSDRAILIGGENLTFSEYFSLFFSAVGNNTTIPASDQEHPLMPDSSLWAGRSIEAYEPDASDEALLGNYRRESIRDTVQRIVKEYRSL
jgi:dihydroflavonol-4-reductase